MVSAMFLAYVGNILESVQCLKHHKPSFNIYTYIRAHIIYIYIYVYMILMWDFIYLNHIFISRYLHIQKTSTCIHLRPHTPGLCRWSAGAVWKLPLTAEPWQFLRCITYDMAWPPAEKMMSQWITDVLLFFLNFSYVLCLFFVEGTSSHWGFCTNLFPWIMVFLRGRGF